MAYSVPLTAVTGTALTAAQWNASVRDNILETPAAKFSASGQLFVSTGPNAGAARTIAANRTTGGPQTTASFGVFVDLVTVGPTIAGIITGDKCLVLATSFIANGTGGGGGYMGYDISGATARAAAPERALRLTSAGANQRARATAVTLETGLTPGTHQVQAKYCTPTGGTAEFDEREIAVIPL